MSDLAPYNDGKDLMPTDILVQEKEGKYCATLGFIPNQGMPKFYAAWGDTPEQAKAFLVDVMKKHLDRAIA